MGKRDSRKCREDSWVIIKLNGQDAMIDSVGIVSFASTEKPEGTTARFNNKKVKQQRRDLSRSELVDESCLLVESTSQSWW